MNVQSDVERMGCVVEEFNDTIDLFDIPTFTDPDAKRLSLTELEIEELWVQSKRLGRVCLVRELAVDNSYQKTYLSPTITVDYGCGGDEAAFHIDVGSKQLFTVIDPFWQHSQLPNLVYPTHDDITEAEFVLKELQKLKIDCDKQRAQIVLDAQQLFELESFEDRSHIYTDCNPSLLSVKERILSGYDGERFQHLFLHDLERMSLSEESGIVITRLLTLTLEDTDENSASIVLQLNTNSTTITVLGEQDGDDDEDASYQEEMIEQFRNAIRIISVNR